MNMLIRSPGPVLKWPGAKWSAQVTPTIIGHFPVHRCYLSLFFGSGGDLFNKAPAPCEVVNDLDDDIVNFFETLRDDRDALAEAVSLTPWSRTEWERAHRRDDGLSKLERARRFVARMNQSHGQRPGCTGWRHDGPARTSSFTLQWRGLPERIVIAAERLRYVQIECRPWHDILARYAGADVLVFADPPYLGEVRKRRRIYRIEMMSAEEHEQLLAALRAHPGPVAVTHYRCPLYDTLLADWVVIEIAVIAEHGQRRVEGLYLNPELVRRLQAGRGQRDLFDPFARGGGMTVVIVLWLPPHLPGGTA